MQMNDDEGFGVFRCDCLKEQKKRLLKAAHQAGYNENSFASEQLHNCRCLWANLCRREPIETVRAMAALTERFH